MPDDVQVIVLYAAAAIALIVVVWRGGAAWAEARVRKARGDRLLGEERLHAYAAMVKVGLPTAAVPGAAAPSAPGVAPAPRPLGGEPPAPRPLGGEPPVPPSSSSSASSSSASSSFRPTPMPVGTFPDPHLLERIQALEAKVAALEAQVGAPASAELAGMRAPRADDGRPEAPRPPGLRAFP